MILVSEIGDKTFFIAAIMAMKHPQRLVRIRGEEESRDDRGERRENDRSKGGGGRVPPPFRDLAPPFFLPPHTLPSILSTQVFAGAMGALATMTALSAALGWAAPALIHAAWTHRAAVALFLVFGARSLYEAATGGGDSAAAEMEEVERELEELHTSRPGGAGAGGAGGRSSATTAATTPPAKPLSARAAAAAFKALPTVLVEAFTLTFLAEWGDRSQIATIGLATTADPVGVTLGGIVGHAVCTGAAVLGGRHLASHINERTVHAVGGLLFLAFGIHAAVAGPG